MNILENDHGIKTDTLSVAKKHYDDFLSIMYDNRLIGPKVQLLIDELGELRLVKDKVDHPGKGSKDLSDATCGAIFNAISHTTRPVDQEVEVLSYADLAKINRVQEPDKPEPIGVIRPPKKEVPDDLQNFLARMKLL